MRGHRILQTCRNATARCGLVADLGHVLSAIQHSLALPACSKQQQRKTSCSVNLACPHSAGPAVLGQLRPGTSTCFHGTCYITGDTTSLSIMAQITYAEHEAHIAVLCLVPAGCCGANSLQSMQQALQLDFFPCSPFDHQERRYLCQAGSIAFLASQVWGSTSDAGHLPG